MAAKGGRIDFMFLSTPSTQPLDPLLGSKEEPEKVNEYSNKQNLRDEDIWMYNNVYKFKST